MKQKDVGAESRLKYRFTLCISELHKMHNYDTKWFMRDTKHLQSNSEKLAQSNKEKILFRSQRKAVNAGANGTLEYTIKEGVNKKKIADGELIKNKK